jgi:hypothetical protein
VVAALAVAVMAAAAQAVAGSPLKAVAVAVAVALMPECQPQTCPAHLFRRKTRIRTAGEASSTPSIHSGPDYPGINGGSIFPPPNANIKPAMSFGGLTHGNPFNPTSKAGNEYRKLTDGTPALHSDWFYAIWAVVGGGVGGSFAKQSTLTLPTQTVPASKPNIGRDGASEIAFYPGKN